MMSPEAMVWSILMTSYVWVFFSLPLCLAYPSSVQLQVKSTPALVNNGMNESLTTDLIDRERLILETETHSPYQSTVTLSTGTRKVLRNRSKTEERGTFLKTKPVEMEIGASQSRVNALQTENPLRLLGFREQNPRGLIQPLTGTRHRSQRSLRTISEDIVDAELVFADTDSGEIALLDHEDTVSEEDKNFEYDFDYHDQTEEEQLQLVQANPPEYMVHLYHMLEGTNIEMLKDTVVTSFANVKHEAPKEDKIGILKYMLAFRTHFAVGTKQPQHTELRVFLEVEDAVSEKSQHGDPTIESCVQVVVLEKIKAKSSDQSNSALKTRVNSLDDSISNKDESSHNNRDDYNTSNKISNGGSGDSIHLDTWMPVARKDVNISKSRWDGIEVTTNETHWQKSKLREFEVQIQNCQTLKGNKDVSDGLENLSVNDTDRPQIAIHVALDSKYDPILVVFSKKQMRRKPFPSMSPAGRTKRDIFAFHAGKTTISTTRGDGFNDKQFTLRHSTAESFDFFSPNEYGDIESEIHKTSKNPVEQLWRDYLDPIKKEDKFRLNSINSFGDLAHILNTVEKLAQRKAEGSTKLHKPINFVTSKNRERKTNVNKVSNTKTEETLESAKLINALPSNQNEQKIDYNKNPRSNGPDETIDHRLKRSTLRRNRRQAGSRSRTARSKRLWMGSCRRVPMYVNFAKINWDSKIVYPTGYQAYQCAGKCFAPISDYLTPTMHAVIQTRLHTVSRRSARRACCVPTRLEPISVLEATGNSMGVYDYHYKFSDMVVAECGCR